MNKESPLHAAGQDVPTWAIAIAAVIVLGFVGYAFYTLTKTLSEEKADKAKQAKKRTERAVKKGKIQASDVEEDGPSAISRGFEWLREQLGGLARDLTVMLLITLFVVEGWRLIPKATIVSCDTVLGDAPGGLCVVAPRMEDPLICAKAPPRPVPGAFPSHEQHVARLCHSVAPNGLLKPTSHYFWDSTGKNWFKQGFLAAVFYRPWSNDKLISMDKGRGASVTIIAKSFEQRLLAFYEKFAPEVASDTVKLANLAAKYHKNPDQSTRDDFEAKTFLALHLKYKTKAMGSQISPAKGSIDTAGAVSGPYRYVGRISTIYDRWSYFVTDILPELY